MLRIRVIRSRGVRRFRHSAGVVNFDESQGWLARVAEPLANELVEGGIVDIPSSEELCVGRYLVRRRAGFGDVLCLTPAARLLTENGAECRIVTRRNYEPMLNGLGNGVHWASPVHSVIMDGWLEQHPGRTERPAALCFGDYWNLDIEDARPHFALTEQETAMGRESVEGWRRNGEPVVAVFMKAGWESRRYRGMLHVAKGLAQEGCAVVGFGDEVLPCCKKPPQMDVRSLAGLLAACDLVVCGDTGPMHLAAALGVPCVAVFCATSAAGSVGPRYDVTALEPEGLDCWPCWKADCKVGELDVPGSCVSAVEPAQVVSAALERLRSPGPRIDQGDRDDEGSIR